MSLFRAFVCVNNLGKRILTGACRGKIGGQPVRLSLELKRPLFDGERALHKWHRTCVAHESSDLRSGCVTRDWYAIEADAADAAVLKQGTCGCDARKTAPSHMRRGILHISMRIW